ncbi:hypothetical protein BROUX41_003367 [Berkeleyomyces rouxiae]|uniref:uncharacterized protein n=1 Tax=Berkeleyomyces rouxiae TaxID=2035830 RepID=UPI003B82442B
MSHFTGRGRRGAVSVTKSFATLSASGLSPVRETNRLRTGTLRASPASPRLGQGAMSTPTSEVGSDDILAGSESGTIVAQAEGLPSGVSVSGRSSSVGVARGAPTLSRDGALDFERRIQPPANPLTQRGRVERWARDLPQARSEDGEDWAPNSSVLSEFGHAAERGRQARENVAEPRGYGHGLANLMVGHRVEGNRFPNHPRHGGAAFAQHVHGQEQTVEAARRRHAAADLQPAAPPAVLLWGQPTDIFGRPYGFAIAYGHPAGHAHHGMHGLPMNPHQGEHVVWLNRCQWCRICAGPICCRGMVCNH